MSSPRRIRYSHRLHGWRRVTPYGRREIFETGRRTVLTGYTFPAPGVAGKKILYFSDLHWDSEQEFYQEIMADILDYTANYSPDVVIFGGDLTAKICFLQDGLNGIGQISAPLKLAVPGNWERRRYWISTRKWQEYFAEAGFRMLIQEWRQAGGFAFFGVDDLKKGNPAPPREYPEGYRVLLAHSADSAVALGRRDVLRRFPLILCGHSHGGQIRLPWIGALNTSSAYGTFFDYGIYRNEAVDSTLMISSGLGYTWIRHRICCQSEAVLINFQ